MPILTKNQTPAKGAKAEFQLDKSLLAAVASVAADSYFSDTSNWKSVEMVYKSNPGKQRRIVKFDASQAAPLANFFASAKARDIFEIEKIVINDFDNGSFTVTRSELTVAEFDINMGSSPSVTYIVYDLNPYNLTFNGVGGVSGGPVSNDSYAKSSTALVGDFEISWKSSFATASSNVMMGVVPSTDMGPSWYSGLLAFYSDGGGQFSIFGASSGSLTTPAGERIYRITRTGIRFKFYVDSTEVFFYDRNTADVYPVVRTFGEIVCTESYKP